MVNTTNKTGSFYTNFLDNLWAQLILATGITALWLIWILIEVLRQPIVS